MTAPDINVVVTDLDGTFWTQEMVVHDATVDAVNRLDAAGTPLLIATGRRALGSIAGLEPAGFAARPIVCMNGALARDSLRSESFHTRTIDTSDALAVFECCAAAGVQPVLYIDRPDYDMVHAPAATAGAQYIGQAPGRHAVGSADELLEVMAAEAVTGFGAFGLKAERVQPIADEINNQGWATAIVGVSLMEGNAAFMVQAHGVDKVTGIEAWCDRHGLAANRFVAVGDGANDMQMLEAAAFAVVPSDAPPEVQELADLIIPPNEEGGWAVLADALGV